MYNKLFFYQKKKVSFWRYLDFCVFVKSTNFKICDIIINIVYYFFWILGSIKKRFGQVSVILWYDKNIYNIFEGWKLVTGSFMIPIKCSITRSFSFLVIDLHHFIRPILCFQKLKKKLESCHNLLLSNWSRLVS